jgi:hypothetical protein
MITKLELTEDEVRDIAIRIVDELVQKDIIPNCIDTDNETEFTCQDIIVEHLSRINKKEVLKKFKGVQTLYHCENDEVEQYVLESLDNMPQEHKDIWENISYGNDLCDSFHFGGHDYIDQEIHLKFFVPNSFTNNNDNEQYNKWTLVKENGHSEMLPIEDSVFMEFDELSFLLKYVKDNLGDLTFNK